MDKAIIAGARAIDYGPYDLEIRHRLTEWDPIHWGTIFNQQEDGQISISKLLRGNWARDVVFKKREQILRRARRVYKKKPYDIDNRKVLLAHDAKTYRYLFTQQLKACAILQVGFSSISGVILKLNFVIAGLSSFPAETSNEPHAPEQSKISD